MVCFVQLLSDKLRNIPAIFRDHCYSVAI